MKTVNKVQTENDKIKFSFEKIWKSEEVKSMRASKQKVFNVYLAGVKKGKLLSKNGDKK